MFMCVMILHKIPQKMPAAKAVWRFDSTGRWLKCWKFSQQVIFDIFILFSPWFWRGRKTWFWFSYKSHGFCNLVARFSLAVLPFFRSLAYGYYFYSAISIRLGENNSLINLLFLRIRQHLSYFLIMNFIPDFQVWLVG